MVQIVKNAPITGDLGSIPGSGSSPGGGQGNPLQYSFLKNPKDRGIWWATVHGVTESDMTERVTQFYEPDTLLGSRTVTVVNEATTVLHRQRTLGPVRSHCY